MVQVGEISVKAKVDTTALDSGTKKVQSRFKEMDASGKMAESGFGRIGSTLGTIGSGLAAVGTAGLAAIGGLASKAPALAGAFASIRVKTGELSRFLGETFKGDVEKVSNSYDKLVDKIKSNPLEAKTGIKALAIGVGTAATVKVATATGITGAIAAAVGAGAAAGGVILGGAILSYLLTKLGIGYASEKFSVGEEGSTENKVGKVAIPTLTGMLLGIPGLGFLQGLKKGIESLFSNKNVEQSTGTDPYSSNRASEEKGYDFDN